MVKKNSCVTYRQVHKTLCGSADRLVTAKRARTVRLLSSPTLSERSRCSENHKVQGKHRHYFLLWLIENIQLLLILWKPFFFFFFFKIACFTKYICLQRILPVFRLPVTAEMKSSEVFLVVLVGTLVWVAMTSLSSRTCFP